MLRVTETDPLALALFTPAELKGIRHLQRRKKGRRAGDITDVQQIELDFEAAGLPHHEREWRFHPTRLWRFDFAWPQQHLALEFEGLFIRRVGGEAILRGRHATRKGVIEDMHKYAEAALLGWRVLRVEQDLVKSGQHVRWVARALGIPSSQLPVQWR